MHAAVRRSVPRRYAGASLAVVTAAAIAVAPMTASVGAVTAPPSTVLVNPAKLVHLQTQVAGSVANLLPRAAGPTVAGVSTAVAAPAWGWGDVSFLADTLRDALKATFESASGAGDYAGAGFPRALQIALDAIKNGSLSGAYSPIGGQIESTLFIGLMSALFPIADRFNPKLGKLGVALDAALNDGSMIALGQAALGLPLRLPTELLKAGEAIAKAIMTGDPTKVGAAVGAGVNNVGKFLEAYVTNSATGLIPNLVKVGSTLLGAVIPSLPASSPAKADALAAQAVVATAPALGMPDFTTLFDTWKMGFDMLVAGLKGDQWSPGVVQTLTDALTKLAQGDPAGAIGKVTDKAKALSIIVLLGGVMPLADFVNPFLGPIGVGLTNSQPDFVAAGNAALAVLFDTPGKVVGIGQNFLTALLSADPSTALTGLTTDIAALTTFLNDRLLVPTDNPFDNALFPALSSIGKNILDAFKPAADVNKPAADVTKPAADGAPAVSPATSEVSTAGVSTPAVPSSAGGATVETQVITAPAEKPVEATPPATPTTPAVSAETPGEPAVQPSTPVEPEAPAEPAVKAPADTAVEAPSDSAGTTPSEGAADSGVEDGASDAASETPSDTASDVEASSAA